MVIPQDFVTDSKDRMTKQLAERLILLVGLEE